MIDITLAALLSGVMFKNNVAMALQGSPTHRYFIGGQKLRFADLACGGAGSRPALISRYFFYTDISQYGCVPRYFTVVIIPLYSDSFIICFLSLILDEGSFG